MQWISLKSLFNIYLHAVFYIMYNICKLVISINDARFTCNNCTCTVCSSLWVLLNCPRFYYYILQSGCCWTVPDFTTARTVHIHIQYFSLSDISLYTAQCHIWETHQSVVNENLAQQQTKNSVAAKPLIGIKQHTQKQFSAKLWLTDMSNKPTACRPQGRGQEDWRSKAGSFSINLLI